jgi:hypothetical protein
MFLAFKIKLIIYVVASPDYVLNPDSIACSNQKSEIWIKNSKPTRF